MLRGGGGGGRWAGGGGGGVNCWGGGGGWVSEGVCFIGWSNLWLSPPAPPLPSLPCPTVSATSPRSRCRTFSAQVPMWSSPREALTISASSTLWRQGPWQLRGARRTSRGSLRQPELRSCDSHVTGTLRLCWSRRWSRCVVGRRGHWIEIGTGME